MKITTTPIPSARNPFTVPLDAIRNDATPAEVLVATLTDRELLELKDNSLDALAVAFRFLRDTNTCAWTLDACRSAQASHGRGDDCGTHPFRIEHPLRSN